jgi:hypothetical protein
MSKRYLTSWNRTKEGFGAHYQTIIYTILYAGFNEMEYAHVSLNTIGHNYENEPDFLEKANDCMNIETNYINIVDVDECNIVEKPHLYTIINFIEDNIGTVTNNNPVFNKIKECFWNNKEKDVYKNNKINIAVHIRRPNKEDCRIEGADTIDEYYLRVMNHIREKYNNNELLFHVYSQGNLELFECYKNTDVVFHIDENVFDTFVGLVGANILVTSKSSFSYIAAFISDAEVYYLPFWHKPKPNWIIL